MKRRIFRFFKPGVEIMMESMVGKVTVREVFSYDDEEMKGGVIVYKVENDDEKLLFGDFYIATFDDMSNEVVWGVGITPESAIQNAEREWDIVNNDEDDNCPNPFKHVLEKIKEGKIVLPKL